MNPKKEKKNRFVTGYETDRYRIKMFYAGMASLLCVNKCEWSSNLNNYFNFFSFFSVFFLHFDPLESRIVEILKTTFMVKLKYVITE